MKRVNALLVAVATCSLILVALVSTGCSNASKAADDLALEAFRGARAPGLYRADSNPQAIPIAQWLISARGNAGASHAIRYADGQDTNVELYLAEGGQVGFYLVQSFAVQRAGTIRLTVLPEGGYSFSEPALVEAIKQAEVAASTP